MSYITEIKLKINLGKNTPPKLIEWIDKCIDSTQKTQYEDHPFFETERWQKIFATYGYDGYSKPTLTKVKNGYTLELHTDINYESEELNTFIDWIKPHILGRKKKVYLGWFERDSQFEKTNVYAYR
jgi:hypothetical protein